MYTYLSGRKRQVERDHSSIGSFPKCPQQLWPRQADPRNSIQTEFSDITDRKSTAYAISSMSISRKLELKVVLGLNPNHSKMGVSFSRNGLTPKPNAWPCTIYCLLFVSWPLTRMQDVKWRNRNLFQKMALECQRITCKRNEVETLPHSDIQKVTQNDHRLNVRTLPHWPNHKSPEET